MENSFCESRNSSFDNLTTDDGNLSHLAKNMFQKTSDYLNFELSSNLLDYELIDSMNKAVSKNVESMKKVAEDVVVVNEDLNQKFHDLEPLLKELDEIEATVNKLENAAYRLDAYTQKLEEKINEHMQKQSTF